MTRCGHFLLILSAVSLAQPARADNTTANSAYSLVIGGPAVGATVSTSGPVDRWYLVGQLVAGRSYCAHTQNGDFNSGVGGNDTTLTVYRNDAITVIGSNDDGTGVEPATYLQSRVCFIAQFTEIALVKVALLFGNTFNVRVGMVDTTLFSNWFFLSGDYGAFTLIRNTTRNPVAYTINWRNSAGTIVATTSGTLNGNASTAVNAGSFPAAVAAVTGTVEIAHNGSPGAIVATTTVLSGTTGLSFDTIFEARPTW